MKKILVVLLLTAMAVAAGCSSKKERKQTAPPVARISIAGSSGAAPLTVMFDATSSTPTHGYIITYFWFFGDGAQDEGPVLMHTFTDPGTYHVTLVATNSYGTADTEYVIITVTDSTSNSAPAAVILASPISGEVPLSVNFDGTPSNDSDGTIVSYQWSFGDGDTDSAAAASHTYTTPGTYTATLVVTDDAGADGADYITITVTQGTINELPTAVISANPAFGDFPLTVDFSATSSSDPDGTIRRYDWRFGDGVSATGVIASHTYDTPGSYTVTLTVTDNSGAADQVSVIIIVNTPPVAVIDAGATVVNSPFSITLDAALSSDSDGTITDYNWDFGDGQTGSGPAVSHTYTDPGTYTVTLTVTDNSGGTGQTMVNIFANVAPVAQVSASPTSGDEPLVVDFSAAASSDSDGTIAGYDWDFGDGQTGSGSVVNHTYSSGAYTVSLLVTDNVGATDLTSVSISVNAIPVAVVNVTGLTSGDPPITVDFDASSSSDGDGSIVSYDWDFGDGTTASGPTASHTYVSPGIYSIVLTLTDDTGGTSQTTVSQVFVNTAPTAAINANPSSGDGPLVVDFSAAPSSDPDGTIVSYDWNFGDGQTDSGAAVTHTYIPGDYTATLLVTDDIGATDQATVSISVNAVPVGVIDTSDPTYGNPPLSISVDAGSSSDSDGSIASYDWDFGDGATDTGTTASHTYNNAGTYAITLTVTDDSGGTSQTTLNVVVNGAPLAVIYADPTIGVPPFTVDFDASGSFDNEGSIVSYEWDFGDGQTDTGVSVTNTYNNYGTYTVQLTVTDDLGVQDLDTFDISVISAMPTAVIEADIYHGLVPIAVTFDGSNSYDADGTVVSYSWDFGDTTTSTSPTPPAHTYSSPGTYAVTLTVIDNDGGTGQVQTVIAVATYREEVVRLTNIERWTYLSSQLSPLKEQSNLDAAAYRHARDMADNGFVGHDGTDGSSYIDRINDSGYAPWITIGENAAGGQPTPQAVVTAWMNSPNHKDNIMHVPFWEIGVSYVFEFSTIYRYYWTQEFGARDRIFPVVINREEIATGSSTVSLYIYGSGWATDMMVSNRSDFAGASWESFSTNKTWTLDPGLGVRTVYVKVRRLATERTYSDSIVVVEQY